jgi:hypothetical protein
MAGPGLAAPLSDAEKFEARGNSASRHASAVLAVLRLRQWHVDAFVDVGLR